MSVQLHVVILCVILTVCTLCRMAPRLQLEKAAWRWAEAVKPEDITHEHIELAYRIAVPACKRGACR